MSKKSLSKHIPSDLHFMLYHSYYNLSCSGLQVTAKIGFCVRISDTFCLKISLTGLLK